jgi:hypothetical protein
MIIRKSLKHYSLHRYGGTSDGKNIEVKIGSVPIGTKPEAIIDDITQDLTPRELNELKDVLAKDQRNILAEKMVSLEDDLKQIAESLKAGVLDGRSISNLVSATKAFLKAVPKEKTQIVSVQGSSTTSDLSTSAP